VTYPGNITSRVTSWYGNVYRVTHMYLGLGLGLDKAEIFLYREVTPGEFPSLKIFILQGR
jgi:hypothetical protein